jgi:preprotein translocase subunit YajC
MNGLILVLLAVALLLVVYLFVIRPKQMTWGATEEEAAQVLIGDDIV